MGAALKEVGIGLIGFGNIGTGTAKLIRENAELLRRRVGIPLRLRRIADLDTKRDRGISLQGVPLTADGFDVIRDPEVQIVIELIGGTGAARDFVLEAIRKGKSVVTANKALLAEHGLEIGREATAAGVDLGFEASVGGGIPIIRALKEGLAANRIQEIYGIINGTCNFILSKMTNEKREFPDVLAEAQKIGLAEANPSFDVDGIDSAHKLAILVWLANGGSVPLKDIYVEGIRDVSAQDIAFAGEFGYRIKLLAIAKEKGDGVEVRVHPTMIPADHLLATVGGANNAIYVKGDFVGPSLFYGQGAGMLPTASAVMSDAIEIARNLRGGGTGRIPPSGFFLHDAGDTVKVSPFAGVRSEYYLRFQVVDKPGVLSKIAGVLGAHSISISSVLQKGRRAESAVPIYIVTHHAKESDMRAALSETDRLPVVMDRTRMIRIENNL
jgi:homoserine dehydrogenase